MRVDTPFLDTHHYSISISPYISILRRLHMKWIFLYIVWCLVYVYFISYAYFLFFNLLCVPNSFILLFFGLVERKKVYIKYVAYSILLLCTKQYTRCSTKSFSLLFRLFDSQWMWFFLFQLNFSFLFFIYYIYLLSFRGFQMSITFFSGDFVFMFFFSFSPLNLIVWYVL